MKHKKFGNKKIYITVGKTVFNEQTLAFGFGRCRNDYVDYLFIGINLVFVFTTLKIKLPKFMQRD